MRLKLHEDAIRAKAQQKKARRNSRGSPTPPGRADAEAESPGVNGGGDLTSLADAMSHKSPSEAGSRSNKDGKSSKPSVGGVASHGTKGDVDPLDELTASATQARTEMVQKVLQGLREEAVELARDIGVDVLTQPGRLRKFVDKLRDIVFGPIIFLTPPLIFLTPRYFLTPPSGPFLCQCSTLLFQPPPCFSDAPLIFLTPPLIFLTPPFFI